MSFQSPDEGWPLEQRLRAIEDELERRALANPDPPGRGALQQPSRPPRVSGLALDTVVGGISVRWNSVSISNLKRYEVQFATNRDMVGAETFFTRETSYTFAGTTAEVEYFVRVRAINASESTGDWSSILSTKSGLIGEEDIEEGAVTDFVWVEPDDFVFTFSGFWQRIGTITMISTVDTPIDIRWVWRLVQANPAGDWGTDVYARFVLEEMITPAFREITLRLGPTVFGDQQTYGEFAVLRPGTGVFDIHLELFIQTIPVNATVTVTDVFGLGTQAKR